MLRVFDDYNDDTYENKKNFDGKEEEYFYGNNDKGEIEIAKIMRTKMKRALCSEQIHQSKHYY